MVDILTIEESFPAQCSGLPRSPGLHLSTVIRVMEQALHGPRKPSGWMMDETREVGFIWEDLLSLVLAQRQVPEPLRPEEIVVDGIAMSPDGIGLWEGHVVLEEYKCTWASINNRSPDTHWPWLVQSKSDCRAIHVNQVIFRILDLMGDYKGSGPLYRAYLLTYTDRDLEENWQMVLNHKQMALDALGIQ